MGLIRSHEALGLGQSRRERVEVGAEAQEEHWSSCTYTVSTGQFCY